MNKLFQHSDRIQKLVDSIFDKFPSFDNAVESLTETADLMCHVGCDNPQIGTEAGWIEEGVKLGMVAAETGKPIFEVHVERSAGRHDGDEAFFYFCDDEAKVVEELTALAKKL